MDIVELLSKIVSVVVGIVAIINGIYGLIKKTTPRTKESIIKYSAFLFIGIILIASVIYTLTKYSRLKAKYELESTRHEITIYRDRLYDVISEYSEACVNNNGILDFDKIGEVLGNTRINFNSLIRISDQKLDIGLKINKYDHLSYFGVLTSSLESFLGNGDKAIVWADTVLKFSNMALHYIDTLKQNENNNYYQTLLTWAEADKVEPRLRYLRAMALAIKLYHHHRSVRPVDIENEIRRIEGTDYLVNYPMSENPHFEAIKDQLDENFKKVYYR
ncbi:MAG: hypothetical protein Kow0042_30680 [Calditrichia bacterium]